MENKQNIKGKCGPRPWLLLLRRLLRGISGPGSPAARMTKGSFPCSPEAASAASCPCASSFHHSHSSGGRSPRHTDAPLVTQTLPGQVSLSVLHTFQPAWLPTPSFPSQLPSSVAVPPLQRASDCFHPSLLWLNNPPSLSPLVNCRRGSCGCCGINHLLSAPESEEPLAVVPSSAFNTAWTNNISTSK